MITQMIKITEWDQCDVIRIYQTDNFYLSRYDNQVLQVIYENYAYSKPMPKLIYEEFLSLFKVWQNIV